MLGRRSLSLSLVLLRRGGGSGSETLSSFSPKTPMNLLNGISFKNYCSRSLGIQSSFSVSNMISSSSSFSSRTTALPLLPRVVSCPITSFSSSSSSSPFSSPFSFSSSLLPNQYQQSLFLRWKSTGSKQAKDVEILLYSKDFKSSSRRMMYSGLSFITLGIVWGLFGFFTFDFLKQTEKARKSAILRQEAGDTEGQVHSKILEFYRNLWKWIKGVFGFSNKSGSSSGTSVAYYSQVLVVFLIPTIAFLFLFAHRSSAHHSIWRLSFTPNSSPPTLKVNTFKFFGGDLFQEIPYKSIITDSVNRGNIVTFKVQGDMTRFILDENAGKIPNKNLLESILFKRALGSPSSKKTKQNRTPIPKSTPPPKFRV